MYDNFFKLTPFYDVVHSTIKRRKSYLSFFCYRTLIVLHDFDFLSPMCMYFYCNGFVNPNNELDGYNCYDIQLLLLMFAVVIQLWN